MKIGLYNNVRIELCRNPHNESKLALYCGYIKYYYPKRDINIISHSKSKYMVLRWV